MQILRGTPIDAVTETTVSDPIGVSNVKKATLAFTRSGHTSGSVIFTVQASINGAYGNYITAVNMISNDVNNHSQTLERNITVELTENDTVFAALDLEHFTYDYIQIKAVESGVGTSTCRIIMQEC